MSGTGSYDVIVVGAGAAGLSAAIFAAQSGASVLVLERSASIGGTSALSGGWMWLPGASRAEAAQADSREAAETYIRSIAGDRYRSDLVAAYLDGVPPVFEVLERSGLRAVHAETAPDYSEHAPGAVSGGRAISADAWSAHGLGRRRRDVRRPLRSMRVFGVVPQLGDELNDFVQANRSLGSFARVAVKIAAAALQTICFGRPTRLTNGNSLVAQLYRIALDAGAEFVLGARVEELTATGARVDGVVAVRAGQSLRLSSRGGVILACGGISHNGDLAAKYFTHVGRGLAHCSVTTAEHDGEAVRLSAPFASRFAEDVEQPAAWAPVTAFGVEGREVFPHLRSIGLPGLIAVNADGSRFTNEADSYHDFGQALIADGEGRSAARAYLIADARTMNTYGIGYAKPLPIPRLAYYRNGYLVKGRTLDEIARKCGVDAEVLRRAVAEYNADAEQGIDTRFGRGETFYNRFRGDKGHRPNPSLGPIGRAPYYASPITIGDLGSFVGLDVDRHARVLGESGEPVEGLYAAGTAAVSPFGGAYPGYGAMLGPAVVMGALAGEWAAATATGE
ncbi:FAD-dependent oxidoreductase [Leucobacter celer]|uniref:FAD-dependent oxidoreductase n=1 Tax=Leucobacter celer TaxID=668625 RepID=UPI0006A79EBF|nr:FAD-dependent oxidoreductase [Leucobacter celer]